MENTPLPSLDEALLAIALYEREVLDARITELEKRIWDSRSDEYREAHKWERSPGFTGAWAG